MMACPDAEHCCPIVFRDLRDLMSSMDFRTRMTFPEPSPPRITSYEPARGKMNQAGYDMLKPARTMALPAMAKPA
jgi:hypothetical protein